MPLNPGRLRPWSSLSTSPRELKLDDVRMERDIRRLKSATEEKQDEHKSPSGKDQSLQAIRDLLNYRVSSSTSSRGLRHATPVTIDSSMHYRLLYLVYRTEQQQEHLRDIIAGMHCHGRNRHNTRLMVKIKEALLKVYAQLLGIRDNNQAVIQQIGDQGNMKAFFCMVESSCSAIEDIPTDGYTEDLDARLGLDAKGVDTDARNQRVRVKLTRSSTMSKEWIAMFKDRPSSDRLNVNKSIDGNSTIGYKSDSRKAMETPGSKLRRTKSITISPTSKNRLYSFEINDQDSGRFSCKNDGVRFDDDVTSSPTGLVPGSQIPNHRQSLAQQHDPKLHSLMRDIDGLIVDAGVAAGSPRASLTYEELMRSKGIKGKGSAQRRKEGQKRTPLRTEEDYFIAELDRLLDEADK